MIASRPGEVDNFYDVSIPPLVWRGFLVIGGLLFIRKRSGATKCLEVFWW